MLRLIWKRMGADCVAMVLFLFRCLVFSAFLAEMAGRVDGAEGGIERLVEFREGTRIRVIFPEGAVLVMRQEDIVLGLSVERRLSVAEISRVSFSREPAMEKLILVQRAVKLLDSDVFGERELGQTQLMEGGRGFRAILEQRMSSRNCSRELRWRLRRVLDALPEEQLPESRLPYDIVTTKAGEVIEGDVGEFLLEAEYRGERLILGRKVLSIREAAGVVESGVTASRLRRIERHGDEAFEGGRVLDFETDPEGGVPVAGDDIGMRYADWGVIFQSSLPGKFVSVNNYEVSGPSRKMSAATHDPLYEGTVTIRFCVPGNPGIPAGVNAVGLWLAIVVKDGTAMQAYDVRGNMIGEIATRSGPSEFLGLSSSEPIHALRVVPNGALDSNYTMDDLTFSPPVAMDSVGVEKYPTVRFRNGDRVICKSMSDAEDGGFLLVPVSFPEMTIKVTRSELAAVHAPLQKSVSTLPPDAFWAELEGGSRVLVSAEKGRSLLRFPGVQLDELPLVSLWGQTRIQMVPPAKTKLNGGDVLIVDGDSVRRVASAGLGDEWILTPGAGEGARYADSPSVWFSLPGSRTPPAATLTCASGEVIDLQGGAGFRLLSFSSEGAVIGMGGGPRWEIPFAEISELRFGEP